MRQTSELYKTLRAEAGSVYEVQVERGGTVYGMDRLVSLSIDQALFEGDGPQIGGNQAARCSLVLREQTANWPRMADFNVRVRLCSEDGERRSEWLSMGRYYTDERSAAGDDLTVTAFDGMLLLEQPWTDKIKEPPAAWPITAKAAGALLQEATGIDLDPRTELDDTVAFVGLNTLSTARQAWSMIAAAHGGSLQMTPEGLLRIVPLASASTGSAAIAGIAVAGVSVVGVSAGTGGGDSQAVQLGRAVSKLDTGESLPGITGVELQTEAGSTAAAGTDDGYVLRGICDFSDDRAALLSLRSVRGYVYRPFTAAGARLDPATELGDTVIIDGTARQIVTAEWSISPHITADIAAPYEAEVDHEYTVPSEAANALRKALQADTQLRSYIEQTAEAIRLGVQEGYLSKEEGAAQYDRLTELVNGSLQSLREDLGDNYYTREDTDSTFSTKEESQDALAALSSSVELTKEELTVAMSQVTKDANERYNTITYFIRYINGVVVVGATDSPMDFRISPQEIAACFNGEATSYWNQDKQRTPKQLEIPVGGSLREGDFIWQPRSSGNLSLMWVGE